MITCKPHQLQHILNGQRRIKDAAKSAKGIMDANVLDKYWYFRFAEELLINRMLYGKDYELKLPEYLVTTRGTIWNS